MDADSISKMTHQQRLQAMESLWDALVHETVEPVSPDWHQALLARRLGNIAEGKADYVSLEDLKVSRCRGIAVTHGKEDYEKNAGIE